MNIVLAGMPGSGKTTVVNCFKKLGKEVFDTDEEIVKKHGAITEIFAQHGEQYFRDLETQAVQELCALNDVVIATGGGCLLREQNINLLKSSGKIVYLRTTVDTLIKRVEGNSERPLLAGDAEKRIKELYAARAHIYEGAADLVIDTDGLSPEKITQIITERMK